MYVYPQIEKAKARGRKYGVEVFSSYKYPFKLYIIRNGREIHFGHRLYSDYLQHGDKERRRRYRLRSKVGDKNSRSYWVRYILW